MARILLVEDDESIRKTLKDFLKASGYSVVEAGRGDEALMLFGTTDVDLVVLDVNLPGIDGFRVCSTIREASKVPIVMLTARREEVDQVTGLQDGANDYIVKPFSPKVLMLKIAKWLEQDTLDAEPVLHYRDLIIDTQSFLVRRGDDPKTALPLELTKTEFELFVTLLQNPRKVFTRSELVAAINDDPSGSDIFERTVDSHIKNLRRKLGKLDYIETVRGIGYRIYRDQ